MWRTYWKNGTVFEIIVWRSGNLPIIQHLIWVSLIHFHSVDLREEYQQSCAKTTDRHTKKGHRKQIALDLLKCAESNEYFFKSDFTVNETHGYDLIQA